MDDRAYAAPPVTVTVVTVAGASSSHAGAVRSPSPSAGQKRSRSQRVHAAVDTRAVLRASLTKLLDTLKTHAHAEALCAAPFDAVNDAACGGDSGGDSSAPPTPNPTRRTLFDAVDLEGLLEHAHADVSRALQTLLAPPLQVLRTCIGPWSSLLRRMAHTLLACVFDHVRGDECLTDLLRKAKDRCFVLPRFAEFNGCDAALEALAQAPSNKLPFSAAAYVFWHPAVAFLDAGDARASYSNWMKARAVCFADVVERLHLNDFSSLTNFHAACKAVLQNAAEYWRPALDQGWRGDPALVESVGSVYGLLEQLLQRHNVGGRTGCVFGVGWVGSARGSFAAGVPRAVPRALAPVPVPVSAVAAATTAVPVPRAAVAAAVPVPRAVAAVAATAVPVLEAATAVPVLEAATAVPVPVLEAATAVPVPVPEAAQARACDV